MMWQYMILNIANIDDDGVNAQIMHVLRVSIIGLHGACGRVENAVKAAMLLLVVVTATRTKKPDLQEFKQNLVIHYV